MTRNGSRLLTVLAAAWAPLVVSAVALALAGGVVTLAEPFVGGDSGAPPAGVIHGWVAPTAAKVLLPAEVCRGNDRLTTLRLSSAGTDASAGVLLLEPPEVLATGAAIDRGAEVKVLDVSAAMAARLPQASLDRPYTRATARCRSWYEQTWELGTLSVSAVDRPLRAGDPITAYVVQQPTHTGVLALLMVHNYEQAVDIDSVRLGAVGSVADTVLAASGWMEHWEAWEQEALAWRAEGRNTRPPDARAAADPSGAEPSRSPPLEPTDPAPPLTWRRTDDLGLRLEPFNVAAIVIGEWTFRERGAHPGKGLFARAWNRLQALTSGRREVVLTFPVLTFSVDGVPSTVGMSEPLYADLR